MSLKVHSQVKQNRQDIDDDNDDDIPTICSSSEINHHKNIIFMSYPCFCSDLRNKAHYECVPLKKDTKQ